MHQLFNNGYSTNEKRPKLIHVLNNVILSFSETLSGKYVKFVK